MDYINDQALNTPDIPDAVPHVPGTVRGKKVSLRQTYWPTKEIIAFCRILMNPPFSFNLVDSSTETTGPERKSQRTIR